MPQLPAVYLGFDKSGLPTGGGSALDAPRRRLAVARWLFMHTNWRVAGGYPTIARSVRRPPGLENAVPYVGALVDENRGWSTIFEDLWTHGWGVGVFAVTLSRYSLYHRVDDAHPAVPDNVLRTDGSSRPVVRRPYGTTPGSWNGNDFDTANLTADRFADAAHTQPTVVLNAANGTLHGQFIKWLMGVRHPGLANAVVYIDNEDSTGVTFSADELAYYRALFTEMTVRRPAQPPLRPGIYAHGDRVGGAADNSTSVLSQLLAQYPELFACQVTYDGGIYKNQLPTGAGGARQASQQGANRFPVTTASALHGMSVRGGPVAPVSWTAWPVIKQWEGNNSSALPPGATAALTFRGSTYQFRFGDANSGWDFDSSTVPDPTYPAASPRIALGSAGRLCMLATADRPDPQDDIAAASGRITVYRIDDRGRVSQHGRSLQPPNGYVVLPGARLTWLGSYLVTLARPIAALECLPVAWRLTASGMSGPVIADPTALPVHAALGGGEVGGQLRIFGPAANGQLRTIVGDPSKPGSFTAADQASGRFFHPGTDIAGAQRKSDTLDLIGVAQDGTLATTWWTSGQGSQSAFAGIGSPGALLPSSRLALAPLGADGLLALGIGSDLRLSAAHWSSKIGRWNGPYAVTVSKVDVAVPHSSIGLWANSSTSAQALVVQGDLTIALYALAPGRSGAWAQQGDAVALGSPVAAGGSVGESTVYAKAPHPMSDLQIGRAGARTIGAAVWIEPGQSRAWITSRADSAGNDQSRGWTPWSAIPPPR